MVAGVPSCLPLAARPRSAALGGAAVLTPAPTSPLKTRVGGSRRRPSGRLCRRGGFRSMFTPGSRACAYKTASGRGQWLNRDSIQEYGGINLYDYVGNEPTYFVDPWGDCWNPFSSEDWGKLFRWLAGTDEPSPAYDPNSYMGMRDQLLGNPGNFGTDPTTGKPITGGDLVADLPGAVMAGLTTAATDGLGGDMGKAENLATDLHHAYPKYLGGPMQQELLKLPRDLHQLYHAGLDAIAPRWKSKAYFDKLSPKAKAALLNKLIDYTIKFDKEHGTKINNALQKAISCSAN
jgi:hypothetical protein